MPLPQPKLLGRQIKELLPNLKRFLTMLDDTAEYVVIDLSVKTREHGHAMIVVCADDGEKKTLLFLWDSGVYTDIAFIPWETQLLDPRERAVQAFCCLTRLSQDEIIRPFAAVFRSH